MAVKQQARPGGVPLGKRRVSDLMARDGVVAQDQKRFVDVVKGRAFEFKFTGTIENKDSVKGKLDSGDLGGGTFTGKRKEPETKQP